MRMTSGYEPPGKLIVKGVTRPISGQRAGIQRAGSGVGEAVGMGAIEDMPMFEHELYQAFGGADAEGGIYAYREAGDVKPGSLLRCAQPAHSFPPPVQPLQSHSTSLQIRSRQ